MPIALSLIVAMVNIVVGVLVVYLVLSGRLEGILRTLSRSMRGSHQSIEPISLTNLSNDMKDARPAELAFCPHCHEKTYQGHYCAKCGKALSK